MLPRRKNKSADELRIHRLLCSEVLHGLVNRLYAPRLKGYFSMPKKAIDRAAIEAQLRADLEAQPQEDHTEAQPQDEKSANRVESWQALTLAEAFKPRPPVEKVVAGLMPRESVSVWFGPPGVQKSLLMLDLAQCVISGAPWLRSKTHTDGRAVMRGAVAWLDLDNGKRESLPRIEAIARGHGFDAETATRCEPLIMWSLPLPRPSGADTALMIDLADYLAARGVVLLIVDNLQRVSPGLKENDNEIDAVMANMRMIAERSRVAVALIHHSTKNAGEKTRKGDALRGHSSIEAGADLAMMVTREGDLSDSPIRVVCTKARGAMPRPFFAQFHYTHKPNTDGELATARFSSEAIRTLDDQVTDAVLEVVRAAAQQGGINKSNLTKAVLEQFQDTSGARNSVFRALENLEAAEKLVSRKGANNATLFLPRI
jgi:hypothetical protein